MSIWFWVQPSSQDNSVFIIFTWSTVIILSEKPGWPWYQIFSPFDSIICSISHPPQHYHLVWADSSGWNNTYANPILFADSVTCHCQSLVVLIYSDHLYYLSIISHLSVTKLLRYYYPSIVLLAVLTWTSWHAFNSAHAAPLRGHLWYSRQKLVHLRSPWIHRRAL